MIFAKSLGVTLLDTLTDLGNEALLDDKISDVKWSICAPIIITGLAQPPTAIQHYAYQANRSSF